ncbi:MAG: hypothetical protein KGZ25_10540, partial [Planctomycetes bacterium]|nr:hypothetical protein [Planctomycetota bacterium]
RKKKWLIFLSGCILGLASFWGTLHLVQNILPGTKPQIRETTNSYLLEHQEAKHFGETQLPVRQHLLSPDLRWWWRQTQQLGTWIVLLLWPIAQLGSIYDHLLVRIIVNVPGWFLTICVLCYMGKKIKTKDWLWLGILFYVGVLFLIHRLRGRYLAPFAPLLLYAIWNSTRGLATSMAEKIEGKSPLQKLRALPYLLLAIIAASNLFVYSVAVRVQRSSDFYATFRAGQYRTIVNAAHYISKQTPPETRIAVTCHAQNLKKHFQYLGPQGPAGSLALLTGRKVIAIQSMSGDKIEGTDQIRKWAEQTNSDYLLVRLPTSPWRLWHFRIPTIQKWLTGRKKIPENPYWLFYKIDKGQIRELTVPNVRNYPTHVPYAR